MAILFYGCGLNINRQLHKDRGPVICCPTLLSFGLKTELQSSLLSPHVISISLSRILLLYGNDLVQSGYEDKSYKQMLSSLSNPKMIRSSEARLVVVTGEEVVISTPNGAKKLHFQYNTNQVENLNSQNEVKDVAVEDNCLITVNKNGQLFSFGIEISLAPNVKIDRVCVGKEHCLALTADGEVLSWGSGMKGQLGNGEIAVVEHPEAVEALRGLKMKDIECGGWHSVALSASGDAYVWGWNDVGQLGIPSKSLRSPGVKLDETSEVFECQCRQLNLHRKKKHDRATASRKFPSIDQFREDSTLINIQTIPKLLELWAGDVPVKKVACGDRHAVFLLENGSSWTTGWNMYGQLGIGCQLSQDEPQEVLHNVEDIYAGGWNTIFKVKESIEKGVLLD